MGDNTDMSSDDERSTFYTNLTRAVKSRKLLEWFHLKELMRFSNLTEQGKQLGLWSLETLEEALGKDWLATVQVRDPELFGILYASTFRNELCLEIAEFALAIRSFEDTQGFAKIRRDLRQNTTLDRFWHSRAIFQLGRLTLMAGGKLTFEEKFQGYTSPLDLVISLKDSPELRCEVFCIFRSKSAINGFERSHRLSARVMSIASSSGVIIDGKCKTMPDDEALNSLCEQLQRLSEHVSHTGVSQKLNHACMDATITPSNGQPGGLGNWTGPVVQGGGLERTIGKLRDKMKQTEASGAQWIFMEVNDDLWQFTEWAVQSLDVKLKMIISWIFELLKESNGCHGIVLSSGVTTALPLHTDETIELADGNYALRRCFEPGVLRVRETIIIPNGLEMREESDLWYELLANERDWLEWALRKYKLPSIEEALRSSSSDAV